MNFYSVRDLRTESRSVWADLETGGEAVLTNNGKPSALIIGIPEGGFDEAVQAVRQAKAMIALNAMRRKAAREGFLSEEDIDALIDEARSGGWDAYRSGYEYPGLRGLVVGPQRQRDFGSCVLAEAYRLLRRAHPG